MKPPHPVVLQKSDSGSQKCKGRLEQIVGNNLGALAWQRSLAGSPLSAWIANEKKQVGGQRIRDRKEFLGEASTGCLEMARDQGIGVGRRRRGGRAHGLWGGVCGCAFKN